MKILVHLGFPKTGSSSLQYGLFSDLEQQDALKLFTWRKNSPDEPLINRPSSCLFNKQDINDDYLDFHANYLNVLSDESFTAPVALRSLNFGDKIVNPFLFPELIKRHIENKYKNADIDLHWLVVIREQASLIYSQYVEEYNWKRFREIDLLFDKNGKITLSGYHIYHFSTYLNELLRLLPKSNCHFFLFEDIVANPSIFSKCMTHLIGNKLELSPNFYNKHHYNQKKRSNYGTFTKDGKVFVPFFSESITAYIREYFNPSNQVLSNFFDLEKLRRYKYINA